MYCHTFKETNHVPGKELVFLPTIFTSKSAILKMDAVKIVNFALK